MEYSTEAVNAPAVGSAVARPGVTAAPWWHSLRLLISFPALMAVMLVAVALIGAESRLIDPDTWWHVTVGEQILKTHTWPTSDQFSFTARGAHWIAYEWLGDVVLALPARAGGLVGLAWFQKVMVTALTLLIYFYAYLVCKNSKAACIASAVVLPLAPMAFTLRPQMFGYIFLLLTLICLQLFRDGHNKALWFLPPLFMGWVNTHGTFVFGLLVIGVYWIAGLVDFRVGDLSGSRLEQPQRVKLLVTLLLCVVALLITPYGSQIAANPIEMAFLQPVNIANIQEWQPLSSANAVGVYLLLFAVVLFLAQVTLRLSYRIEGMILLLFSMYAAFAHLRFAMIFVVFAAPTVAFILARWLPPYDSGKDKWALNIAIIALVFLGIVKYRPSLKTLETAVARDYPVQAVEYLRTHPQSVGIFNEYGWGGYLISQLGPTQLVFIDGRADLYEYSGIFADYLEASSGQVNAPAILARHNIRLCLLNRTSALAALLAHSENWNQVYSDTLSVIFVQRAGPTEPGRARS
jgi:hypothetical protein